MSSAVSVRQSATRKQETFRLTPAQLLLIRKLAVRQTECRYYLAVKVLLEPVVAALLMTVLAPLLLLIAVLVKITTPGPVFYKQKRIGFLGKPFTLYKFRTMYEDAEKEGPQWCSRNDARVTPAGRLLRRTRFDELPQLVNVLRGEMTFFGPRPERPEIYKLLHKHLPLFPIRTIVRPGITGWAQVYAGYAASITQSRIKLKFDTYYIKNLSPLLDLKILFKTPLVVIMGDRLKQEGRDSLLEELSEHALDPEEAHQVEKRTA